MHSSQLLALTAFAASAIAQSSSTTSSASSLPTEVTGCHEHGAGEFFCFDGDDEWEVVSSGMTAETLPSDFEDCHAHGEELHCVEGQVDATLALASSEDEGEHDDSHDHDESHSTTSATATAAAATGSSAMNGTTTSSSSSSSASSSSAYPTAVTSCHAHDESELYCLDGSDEWEVTSEWDQNNPPESFDDCHNDGDELHCVGDSGNEATLIAATEAHSTEDDSPSSTASSSGSSASASATTASSDSDSAAPPSASMGRAGILLAASFLVYAAYVC